MSKARSWQRDVCFQTGAVLIEALALLLLLLLLREPFFRLDGPSLVIELPPLLLWKEQCQTHFSLHQRGCHPRSAQPQHNRTHPAERRWLSPPDAAHSQWAILAQPQPSKLQLVIQ